MASINEVKLQLEMAPGKGILKKHLQRVINENAKEKPKLNGVNKLANHSVRLQCQTLDDAKLVQSVN